MTGGRGRIAVALATLAGWTAVTLFGALLILPPGTELQDLATRGVAWQIVLAAGLVLAVVRWRGWRDIGFRRPAPGTLRLLWLPGLVLSMLFGAAFALGPPPAGAALMVAANSMLVGLSEETMFRGVLYRALRGRLAIWPAILATSAAFGAVHVMNGAITGDFGAAAAQACMAAATGLLLMAILLRTGSLWTVIVFHGLWDCATFLIVLGAGQQGAEPPPEAGGLLMPVLLVLPGALYALWLLRKVHKGPVPGDPMPT